MNIQNSGRSSTYTVDLANTNRNCSYDGEFEIKKDGETTPRKYSCGKMVIASLDMRLRSGRVSIDGIKFTYGVLRIPEFVVYQEKLNASLQKIKQESGIEAIANKQPN